jgi:putative permease
MLQFLNEWYRRYFSDPQAVFLSLLLLFLFAVIIFMGNMLAPLFAAIVIAYLLETPVRKLEGAGLPRNLAVTSIFLPFMAALLILVLGLIPVLSTQVTQFFQELPNLINDGHQLLRRLPETYPQFFSTEQVDEIINAIQRTLTEFGHSVLSVSLASIPEVITLVVYLIIGPLLVFFLLKDKGIIVAWLKGFLPRDRRLLTEVWIEMDAQIGNYIRGKFTELIIVAVVTYIIFAWMGLSYALLLAVLNGLSVVVPFVGTTLVTVPVVFAAYAQWGWTADVVWVTVAYFGIHLVDANFVVPLLFSEAVDLHPVAIIVAILVFGGLWGFWGVFFAIPLATLVRALLTIWPRSGAELASR